MLCSNLSSTCLRGNTFFPPCNSYSFFKKKKLKRKKNIFEYKKQKQYKKEAKTYSTIAITKKEKKKESGSLFKVLKKEGNIAL